MTRVASKVLSKKSPRKIVRADMRQHGGAAHELRIIGGEWRGRKLQFPALDAIRPSPNRVRETLFNWLQNEIHGKHCLDLFAGSGALGFEALSRGAAHVTFVDREPKIGLYLKQTLQRLKAENAAVQVADATKFLRGAPQRFDIVFLDPPFAAQLLPQICELLHAGRWLNRAAFIYLENSSNEALPVLPPTWQIMKSKSAGQVGYHLLRAMTIK